MVKYVKSLQTNGQTDGQWAYWRYSSGDHKRLNFKIIHWLICVWKIQVGADEMYSVPVDKSACT